MRILIACECSGIVRDAFTASGHDATSCDKKDSKSPGKHYKGDVFDIINDGFDMMIAFPPCTYIAKAQMWRCLRDSDRASFRDEAVEFVDRLYNCSIPKVAIENPVGYLNSNWNHPTQIIYPYMFGAPYRKDICLWLKNLPPLIGTCYSTGRKSMSNHVNGRMSQDLKSEIKSSWKYFGGIADAMVHQWSTYI